ncbi:hypothetical protein T08_12960 [Trichinella sp. T8]|nr:hypothetical protein T08_12960 [Trichinella sp. T8]
MLITPICGGKDFSPKLQNFTSYIHLAVFAKISENFFFKIWSFFIAIVLYKLQRFVSLIIITKLKQSTLTVSNNNRKASTWANNCIWMKRKVGIFVGLTREYEAWQKIIRQESQNN